ncbi:MBL fold metallo-hydrolase, partial [Candidatus Uhrbacteria bacterium]|nr:MBL fold metallo-hydrolase [Candidatus Uhrbacteria bacterium]
EQIEALAQVDVLLVPIGGGDTLGYKEAMELINEIEPRVVVPMHYQIPGQKTSLDGVAKFAKEMSVSADAEEDKLKLSRKDLPEENTKTVILKQAL